MWEDGVGEQGCGRAGGGRVGVGRAQYGDCWSCTSASSWSGDFGTLFFCIGCPLVILTPVAFFKQWDDDACLPKAAHFASLYCRFAVFSCCQGCMQVFVLSCKSSAAAPIEVFGVRVNVMVMPKAAGLAQHTVISRSWTFHTPIQDLLQTSSN